MNPSLAELKSKWFIPTEGHCPDGIPRERVPENEETNRLSVSTDGNTVIPLIDGQALMQAWLDSLRSLHWAPDAEIYHAGWRFDGIKALGATAPDGDVLDEFDDANRAGVAGYVLVCSNLLCLRFNRPFVKRLRRRQFLTACLDNRYPPGGSNHQKLTVMKSRDRATAFVGSLDLARTRWDSPKHLAVDPDRDPKYGKQTHEAGVSIEGPAIGDLEKTFRARWNDPRSVPGRPPMMSPRSQITTPLSPTKGQGTHSIQVLRTYGITPRALGYSWSPIGEFTVWASHINALKKASTFVYIEDQCFLPFGWPPCHTRSGTARDTDVVYQLGEAMKRGVNVVILTICSEPSAWSQYQKYHRDVGVNYLHSIRAQGSPGDVVVATLESGGKEIYVHSKLMIVDDEFISVGSANIAQRSMATDSELQLGIVDEANMLARDFRARLWSEHSWLPSERLDEPNAAFELLKQSVADLAGHLRPYVVNPLSAHPSSLASPPQGHALIIRRGIDPYAGPPALR